MLSTFVAMYHLTRHIEYLLRHHSCVVVPGIGALLVQWLPARRDAVTGEMIPPRRTVIFNPSLNHDDGLLATSITRKEGMEYAEASRLVADESAAMRRQMADDGSLGLGRVGTLKRNGSSWLFTASPWASHCCDTYGLMPLKVAEGVQAPEEDAYEAHRAPRTLHWIRPLKVAAMIAVLLLVGLVITTPIEAPQPLHKASISVKVHGPRLAAVPQATRFVIPMVSDSLATAVIDTAARSDYQRRMRLAATQSSRAIRANGPYTLVVASLDSPEKAARYIAEHPGQALEIWPYNDNYRITSGHAASPEVLQGRSRLWPGSWVAYRR